MKKYFCIPAIAAMLFLTLFAFASCTGAFIDPSYADYMNNSGDDGNDDDNGGGNDDGLESLVGTEWVATDDDGGTITISFTSSTVSIWVIPSVPMPLLVPYTQNGSTGEFVMLGEILTMELSGNKLTLNGTDGVLVFKRT